MRVCTQVLEWVWLGCGIRARVNSGFFLSLLPHWLCGGACLANRCLLGLGPVPEAVQAWSLNTLGVSEGLPAGGGESGWPGGTAEYGWSCSLSTDVLSPAAAASSLQTPAFQGLSSL